MNTSFKNVVLNTLLEEEEKKEDLPKGDSKLDNNKKLWDSLLESEEPLRAGGTKNDLIY